MKYIATICILAIIIGSCIVYSFLALKTDLIPYEIVQDERSQRVVARKTIFGYTISENELSAGNGSPDSGVWNRGVIAVFDTPLKLGDRFWVRKGRHEVAISLISLQFDFADSRADFMIESADGIKTVSLSMEEKINAGPDISIAWSPRNSRSVYIFADGYPLKERSQMYGVKFSEDGRYLKAPTD